MSDIAHAPTAPASPAPAGGAHHHTNYVKIWAVLVGLLVVSVVGPMVGIRWLTLVTAFGIAIVKAYLVARNFMHINLEKRWVAYLLLGMLAFMGIFMGGVSPDVMKHDGANWSNDAAKRWVEKGLSEAPKEAER